MSDSGFASWVLAAANGHQGAVICWQGGTSQELDQNLFCQALDSHGVRLFGPTGIRATAMSGDQYVESIASDGLGGVFFTWTSFPGYDVYAQHVLSTGKIAPGWPTDGAPVCVAPGEQRDSRAIVDSSGNLLIFWDDYRAGSNSPDIYCLRLDSDGSPAPDWSANGRPVLGSPGVRGAIYPIEDGQGGYYVAWGQLSNLSGPPDAFLLRLTSSLDPYPSWPALGRLAVSGRAHRGIAADGQGGVYLASEVKSPTNIYEDKDYYLQRFTGAGDLAPGWLALGNPVCTAPVFRYAPQIMPDGQGGAILQWQDSRTPALGELLYAMRMMPDGTRAPGWPVDGQRVTNAIGYEEVCSMVSDGMGGAYFAFNREYPGYDAYLQHLLADGTVAPGFPAEGALLGYSARGPSVVTDGAAGAIVAWYSDDTDKPLAQRYVFDGIVATQLSLVSSDASADGVTLVWQGAGASTVAAWVERRAVDGMWVKLGEPSRDAPDRLRYEDHDVEAGKSYGYRLGWNEAGQAVWTTESRVEVPSGAVLSLVGLRPNPAVGDLRVEFSLPNASSATLELLDLAGRRVLDREVSALGAGRHQIRLEPQGRVAPGVYWLRLRQGAEQRRVRGVVMK